MSAGSDRLERSRLAILEHLHRRDQRRHPPVDPALDSHESGEGQVGTGPRARRRRPAPGSWMERVREAVDSWWRYHPAHMVVDLASPLMREYARRRPVQLLAISVAAGAALTFARPWKLISIGTLAVALLKSSQLSSLLMAAMSAADYRKDNEPPR